MAGDWIKFEKSTLDKPEVFEMAGILNLDPDAVIGKLLRVWDWFDDQSVDGYAPVTLAAQLNRNTGCAQFTAAMQQVGWMIIENDRLKIPNFTRHNGQTAKDRSLSAKRMAKSRGKSCGDSVTPSVTKPQPEKRREEKSNTPVIPKGNDMKLAESIYDEYPRKEGRKKGVEAIIKAMRKHDANFLMERTKTYAATYGSWKEKQFIPLPATWFNGERFNDNPQLWEVPCKSETTSVNQMGLSRTNSVTNCAL